MKNVLIVAALGCAMTVAFPVAAAAAGASSDAGSTGNMGNMGNMSHMGDMSHMSGMDAQAASGAAASPSSDAFRRADRRMMADMDAPYVGDADRDFVAHMIPHHQGAVAMAEVELKYGKDPALRRLATDIVRAQRDEIALMRRWQAEHGVK